MFWTILKVLRTLKKRVAFNMAEYPTHAPNPDSDQSSHRALPEMLNGRLGNDNYQFRKSLLLTRLGFEARRFGPGSQ